MPDKDPSWFYKPPPSWFDGRHQDSDEVAPLQDQAHHHEAAAASARTASELNPRHFLHPRPATGAELRSIDPPQPLTVWAKLDHIQQATEGHSLAVLDCIDANWFEAAIEGSPQLRAGWLTRSLDAGEHISIVVIALSRLQGGGKWHRLTLAEESGPRAWGDASDQIAQLHERSMVLQSDAALDPPRLRPVTEVRKATKSEAAALGAAGSLVDDVDATHTQLREVLAGVESADSAAVFDVGQGNFNALLKNGVPMLLFDIGGGVSNNLRTFPKDFDSFCFAGRPPVILSHWDWDHWSSAARFPMSQRLRWIVPRQGSLGPAHSTLLAVIREHGGAPLVMPRQTVIKTRTLELWQAKGPVRNINENGLGLIASGPHNQRVLFTGDAGYKSLDVRDRVITSVVVPHHGGRSRSSAASQPTSDGKPNGRAVVSCGPGNSYGHPLRASEELHQGWAAGYLGTCHRATSPNVGHVEIHWEDGGTATRECCQASPLPLPQR